MRVIIYSSDKTSWALQPFAHLFNLYYMDTIPVCVFGNTAPAFKLPLNFSFESVGSFQPVEEWTTDLVTALKCIKDEVILFMMDDYWINRQVDARAIQWCYQYMLEHPAVGRFDVCTDRLYAAGMSDYTKIGYLDVIKSDPKSPYHFSFQASLWNRHTLIDCLHRHETPWDAEMRGDARLRALGSMVLGTRQGPMRYTIAVQRGKFTPDGGYQTPSNAMNRSDIDFIMKQGWISAEYLK